MNMFWAASWWAFLIWLSNEFILQERQCPTIQFISYYSVAVPMIRSGPFRKCHRALETPLFFAWRKLFFVNLCSWNIVFVLLIIRSSKEANLIILSAKSHYRTQILKVKLKTEFSSYYYFTMGKNCRFFDNYIETICHHQTLPWTDTFFKKISYPRCWYHLDQTISRAM